MTLNLIRSLIGNSCLEFTKTVKINYFIQRLIMQESKNCKKELNYAETQDVSIVPIMAEKDWKQTGWLGVITAGLLWIDFRYVSILILT